MKPSRDIARLIEIMAALRTPGTGCPWDLEQNFATIAPYTIEEAYEVADAIARGDLADLRDELGDLLLQVVFHARMAEEQGAFDFGDVVEAITEKLIRRHPHVFGDARGADARGGRRRCGSASRPRRRPSASRSADGGAGALCRRAASPCPRSPARSSCRRRPARSASTGTIRSRCSPRSARKPTRSRPSSSDGDRRRSSRRGRRPAVRRGQSGAPSRRRSGSGAARRPTPSSSAASPRSSGRWPANGKTPQDATLAEMDALWDAAKARARDGRSACITWPSRGAAARIAPSRPWPPWLRSTRTVMARPSVVGAAIFPMHLGVAVQPAHPGAVGRIEHELEDDAALRPAVPRSRSASRRAPPRSAPTPAPAGARPACARPDWRCARGLRRRAGRSCSRPRSAARPCRLDAELAQHLLDVARLRLGVRDARRRARAGSRRPRSPLPAWRGTPRPAWSAGRR